MSNDQVLLRIDGLRKRLGGHEILRGLGLTVHRGDVYGLLGLNGAGKSTTLRCLTGLLRPDAGTITFDGRTLRAGRAEDRTGIGAMVEGPAFFPRLSARDNLRRVSALTSDLSDTEIEDLLRLVGLEAAASRPARTYSLGMRQRLGIAMALAGDPDLVVLDEPSNGLDPRGMQDIRRLIHRLNDEHGRTLLVSSHLLREIEEVCTRVGIVRDGVVVAEGGVTELMAESTGTRLVLHCAPADEAERVLDGMEGVGTVVRLAPETLEITGSRVAAADLNRALVSAGCAVHGLIPERASLEEVFHASHDGVPR